MAAGGLATVIIGGICIATGVGAPLGAMMIGGVACVFASIDTSEKLQGEFDLPMILYSPYAIFSNSIPIFDINFFSPNVQKENKIITLSQGEVEKNLQIKSESSAKLLQPYISGWYYALRNFAIIALLSILVYVGIRMIISTASKDKAKYKQMLLDWLVAMCLVITMHYIMIVVVNISEKLCNVFSNMTVENILAPLPKNTKYELDGIWYEVEEDTNVGGPVWATNFIGYARLLAQGTKETDEWMSVEFTIIYVVLVIETLIFTIIYLKRVLYMAFLTMIAPLVAMTYPIDKLNDGQAQGFNKWLREYIFNALLAPIHMMIYAILVGSAMGLAEKYPVYAIVALGFMIPAEKLIRSLFGFEKAQSPATMGAVGLAGTGMLMSGIGKLLHAGKRRGERNEENKDNNIRFKPENTNTLETYVNENSNTETSERPQLNSEEENNSSSNEDNGRPRLNSEEENNSSSNEQNNSQHAMPDAYDENFGTEERNLQERDTMVRELDSGERTNYTDDLEYTYVRNNSTQSSVNNNEETRDLNQNNGIIDRTNRNSINNQQQSKPKIRKRIRNGLRNVGAMGVRRFKRSHPLRKIGNGIAYGIGAGTLGMIGLAAGIASGDLGKTAQYTGTAAHVGGSAGKGIANRVGGKGNKIVEEFKQGYYGTEYEDKLRERQIREWQTDPNNVQYLRARDENYRQILRDVYPEYARYGCYNIEDFYAAYQLEKAGRSRAQAISAYKLAKRTGDITASPDLENKWRTRLETEFGDVEDVRNVTDSQYSRIEEEFKSEQEKIDAEYEEQRRAIESTMLNQEEEYKKLEQELEREQNKLEEEYEEQYRKLEASTLDDELEYKEIEEKYKQSEGPDKKKYEAKYKEMYKKMQNSTTDKKLKQKKLKERYEKNQQKLQDKYEKKYKNINASQEEKFEKIKEERNEKYKKLKEETEAKKVKVKGIPSGFAETALDDVRIFYENKG